MNRTRYIDRRILCEYDLREEFFESLGLKIQDMIPLRKVFILFTDKGKLILKLTNLEEDKINFTNKALKYIREKNTNILQYWENKNGEIITKRDNNKYVLLDLIEGREATFTNPVEVELCAKAIANMHIGSIGIDKIFTEEEIKKYSAKNLLLEFNNDLLLLNDIEKVVNQFKFKNKFDNLFLENVNKAKNDLRRSLELLSKSKYRQMYNLENKVLCHNDLAHHNFILDNDNVNIIDFDYCDIDIRILDIYNYTVKVLKSYFYDTEIFNLIINSYSEISPISDDEKEVLYCLMTYPRDFVNITREYYLKEKSWDEEAFIGKLESKIEIDPYRTEFLQKMILND